MDKLSKSLALAKLMGWDIECEDDDLAPIINDYGKLFGRVTLAPYRNTPNGLAQFAAIHLEFYGHIHAHVVRNGGGFYDMVSLLKPLTQGDILDLILRIEQAEQ